MSAVGFRAAPRLPVLDPHFQWEGRLNREEKRGFNPLSDRNLCSETGSRGAPSLTVDGANHE
jgi:hypothetical protein